MSVQKLNYLTNLRVMATIAVLFIHAGANILVDFGRIPDSIWWPANVYKSVFQFAVPIFVMLSGALLLAREESYSVFLIKSFRRIILPFLFYNTLYSLFNWQIRLGGRSVGINWIANQFFYGASYHFWYIYMIIGLYLFIPIIGSWVRRAQTSHLHFFLVLWFLTFFSNDSKFPWLNLPIKLPYFSGYIGYLVLGYFLTLRTYSKLIAWLLFIGGVCWTGIANYHESVLAGKFYGLFADNFSPSAMFCSAGIFMIMKADVSERRSSYQIWEWISSHSYGIYLIHILCLFYLAKLGIYGGMIHPSVGIPFTVIVCLGVSGSIVWILKRIPLGKYIAG